MISIAILDVSADSRNRLISRINTLLCADAVQTASIPRVSLKPVSREELKFTGTPDIWIVGDELTASEPGDITRVKGLFPDTPILASAGARSLDLAFVEQLARMGADDVMAPDISPSDFLRKLILLSRRSLKPGAGKLVVIEGAKGGTGVTTVAASLADCLHRSGGRVAIVDFDFESQDLSRFLQVRPFVNENLQVLLDEQRPVSEESVRDCIVKLWAEYDNFVCMPPIADNDELQGGHGRKVSLLMNVLEVLDSLFEVVIVDTGCARGVLRKTLYQVADRVVCVMNTDPASFYASADRVLQIKSLLSAGCPLVLFENGCFSFGLSPKLLKEEFARVTKIDASQWSATAAPFSRAGAHWPGAMATLYELGGRRVQAAFNELLEKLDLGFDIRAQKEGLVGSLVKSAGQLLPRKAPMTPANPSLPESRAGKPAGVIPLQAGAKEGSHRLLGGVASAPVDISKEDTPAETLISGARMIGTVG